MIGLDDLQDVLLAVVEHVMPAITQPCSDTAVGEPGGRPGPPIAGDDHLDQRLRRCARRRHIAGRTELPDGHRLIRTRAQFHHQSARFPADGGRDWRLGIGGRRTDGRWSQCAWLPSGWYE